MERSTNAGHSFLMLMIAASVAGGRDAYGPKGVREEASDCILKSTYCKRLGRCRKALPSRSIAKYGKQQSTDWRAWYKHIVA